MKLPDKVAILQVERNKASEFTLQKSLATREAKLFKQKCLFASSTVKRMNKINVPYIFTGGGSGQCQKTRKVIFQGRKGS